MGKSRHTVTAAPLAEAISFDQSKHGLTHSSHKAKSIIAVTIEQVWELEQSQRHDRR
jgi:hypothetical protein